MNQISKKNHKCSILLPSLGGGGAEKVFAGLYNYLIEEKYNVSLILLDLKGANLLKIKNKLNLVNLKTKRVSKSIPKIIFFLLKNKPKVVLSAMSHTNIALIISCLIYKIISKNEIRIIVSERAPTNFLFPYEKSIYNKLIRFLIKFFYNYAEKIISVSDGVKRDLIKDFRIEKEKIFTIMNPVDLSDKTLTKKLTKPFLWFKDSVPIGISIGRLSKEKGFDTLLKAIKEVNKFIEYRHIICGVGKEKENLIKNLIQLNLEDKVHFADYVEDTNIWIRNSNVFVCTSRWEGCPNVILEALACNIPVISTNCPYGPSELLQKGKWGRLVDVDSVNQISRAIIEVIKFPLNKDLKLKTYLKENFSKETIYKKYESIIFNGII
tara:strand:- start:63 stop:1202 length:1140 start_codon:yes stop_codon:yes gene_type:complete